MNWTNFFSVLADAFDSGHCLELVREIWENDRWFTFSAFERTAAFCERQMREAGLSEVERLPLKADGHTAYGDWVIPRAWDVSEAYLELPDGRRLADYQSVPCSLVMYSAPTPPEGIWAEVLAVEDPNQVNPASVKGKLLLTDRTSRELIPLAMEGGAVGILSDFIPLSAARKTLDGLEEVSRWDNDFRVPVNDTGLFAFSLSPNSGRLLRSLLRDGPVCLYAKVSTRFYDGECYTVSGLLPGSDPEAKELLLYGHLCEPGAEDNASGCALLMELAEKLAALIREGYLSRPQRGIRFVIGYECVGSMGYLALHPERAGRQLCAIVADMVGTEKIDNAHLGIWHDPVSNWSFLDAVLPAVVRDWQKTERQIFQWEERPFSVGSDNIMADPCWGFPTAAMITEPAFSYHSSLDTPDRIEPETLRRNAAILGAAALWLASAGPEEAGQLADWLLEKPDEWLGSCQASLREAALKQAMESLKRLGLEELPPCAETSLPELPSSVGTLESNKIYRRKVPGCLTFATAPKLRDSPWKPAWNDSLNCPLFWADGRRTLWQIAVLSAWEQGKTQDREIREEFLRLHAYFSFLEVHGYLESNYNGERGE